MSRVGTTLPSAIFAARATRLALSERRVSHTRFGFSIFIVSPGRVGRSERYFAASPRSINADGTSLRSL